MNARKNSSLNESQLNALISRFESQISSLNTNDGLNLLEDFFASHSKELHKYKKAQKRFQQLYQHQVEVVTKNLEHISRRLFLELDQVTNTKTTEASPKSHQNNANAFNNLAQHIVKDILSHDSIDRRTLAVERWIAIMQKSFANGDYHTVMCVNGALHNSSISRLTATFQGLSPQALLVSQTIDAAFKKFTDLDKLLAQADNKPVIVYFPWVKSTYTFASENMSSEKLPYENIIAKNQEELRKMTSIYSEDSQSSFSYAQLIEKHIDEETHPLSCTREDIKNPPSPSNILKDFPNILFDKKDKFVIKNTTPSLNSTNTASNEITSLKRTLNSVNRDITNILMALSKTANQVYRDFNAIDNQRVQDVQALESPYNIAIMEDNISLEKNTLYIEKKDDLLHYTIINSEGETKKGFVAENSVKHVFTTPSNPEDAKKFLNELKKYFDEILVITTKNGHTPLASLEKKLELIKAVNKTSLQKQANYLADILNPKKNPSLHKHDHFDTLKKLLGKDTQSIQLIKQLKTLFEIKINIDGKLTKMESESTSNDNKSNANTGESLLDLSPSMAVAQSTAPTPSSSLQPAERVNPSGAEILSALERQVSTPALSSLLSSSPSSSMLANGKVPTQSTTAWLSANRAAQARKSYIDNRSQSIANFGTRSSVKHLSTIQPSDFTVLEMQEKPANSPAAIALPASSIQSAEAPKPSGSQATVNIIEKAKKDYAKRKSQSLATISGTVKTGVQFFSAVGLEEEGRCRSESALSTKNKDTTAIKKGNTKEKIDQYIQLSQGLQTLKRR